MLKAAARVIASWFGAPHPGGAAFHPRQTCPECGSRLLRESDAASSWHCPNADCPARIRARLERWCSPAAMDIAGADAALVARLVGGGLVRDVAELYRLKLREIASLDGVDEELAAKFCDALNGSRRREGWRALSGLDIPQVAAAEAKSLCRQFGSVDNVFAVSAERLMAAEGIGEATAQSIARWHSDPENRRVLRRLQRAGVNFRSGL